LLNSKVADLGEMVQIMFYLRLPKPHAEIPALNIQPYKPVILLIVQKVSCELSMPRPFVFESIANFNFCCKKYARTGKIRLSYKLKLNFGVNYPPKNCLNKTLVKQIFTS
jgi:hypothetical protein